MSKIPELIYVTAKKQPIREYDTALGSWLVTGYGPNFGFMQPYNPKKPDDKKHLTQREWAYHERHGTTFYQVGDIWYRKGETMDWQTKVKTQFDEPVDPQPVILKNEPLDGFKIQKFVSRYSTSNKLWRILDPRGFELEISTASLEEIIANSDIEKGGIIKSKCVWLSNKNLKVAT